MIVLKVIRALNPLYWGKRHLNTRLLIQKWRLQRIQVVKHVKHRQSSREAIHMNLRPIVSVKRPMVIPYCDSWYLESRNQSLSGYDEEKVMDASANHNSVWCFFSLLLKGVCNRTIYCTEFGAICVSSTHILFLPLIGNLTVSRKCVSWTTIQSLLLFWRSPSYQDHVEIWMLLQK